MKLDFSFLTKNIYIIIGLLLTIIIYFVYISSNTEQYFHHIVSFINILPIPKIIKDLINLFFLKSLSRNNKVNKVNKVGIDIKSNCANIRSSFEKRKVTPLTKKIVASNQKWVCGHCKELLDYTYEVDHIIPLFRGGSNQLNNLQALCRNCHGKKTLNCL